MKAIPNPEYAKAIYELRLIGPHGAIKYELPVRGNKIKNGLIVDPIPPFILQPEGDSENPDDGLPDEEPDDDE